MTQQKLQQPIVMCGLGRLYSKQSVIEQLLEKDKMPESCGHIKSMKDIKDLRLTANPAYSAEDEKNAPFICALIGLEMSGQFRKFYLNFNFLSKFLTYFHFNRIRCFVELRMCIFRTCIKGIKVQYLLNLSNSILRRGYCDSERKRRRRGPNENENGSSCSQIKGIKKGKED